VSTGTPLILSLDTTSRHSSISISRGDDIEIEYNFISMDTLSASLIPSLQFVMDSKEIKPADIDVYGIATGPGLFTGIRVGLSTLKGILFGLQKPVVPVLTVKATAYKCLEAMDGQTIISLLDARREEVYMAAYHCRGNTLEEVIPSCLVHIDELSQAVDKIENLYFIGSGVEIHREKIEEKFGTGKTIDRSLFLAPEICKIANREFLAGRYINDLRELTPVYIRKPDAEMNFRPPTAAK
jgi:tRNA threonylcarbamoyladenosine biosynthesis protein TsaB